jgi:HD-GYP domain-containing protein (c-di-GMP phosphodiesterase class II)
MHTISSTTRVTSQPTRTAITATPSATAQHAGAPVGMRIETEAWLALAENMNDGDAVTHSTRVGALAARLGFEVGLPAGDIAALDLGARLHDIGKLFVPDAILLSTGKLTAESRAIMETHTVRGAELLSLAKSPTVRLAAQIARHHHERWDGSGYPDKLVGEDIPLVARITALADVYDALRSERSYKSAWSHEEAVTEIKANRGSQFDPELTDIFLRMLEREISGAQQHFYATDVTVCSSTTVARYCDLPMIVSTVRTVAPSTMVCAVRRYAKPHQMEALPA